MIRLIRTPCHLPLVIPAKAGIQTALLKKKLLVFSQVFFLRSLFLKGFIWIPAFAGMTSGGGDDH